MNNALNLKCHSLEETKDPRPFFFKATVFEVYCDILIFLYFQIWFLMIHSSQWCYLELDTLVMAVVYLVVPGENLDGKPAGLGLL